jgi:hypothetical protein
MMLTGCFFLSLVVIDRIFLIENLVEMAALGIRKFASQIFLVGDFSVVLISLVLEIVFHVMKSKFQEVAELLVFFRLWRFVRIGHVSFHRVKLKSIWDCYSFLG